MMLMDDGGWMMILVVELLYGEVRNMNEKRHDANDAMMHGDGTYPL